MRNIKCYALLLILLCLAVPAAAETSIAVVDMQAILNQSNAAKSIDKQITNYKTKFLDELAKQEQDLRDNEKKLGEQRATLSKEEFSAQAKELEKKFIATGNLTQTKKRSLDKASLVALDQLHEKLYEIVQSIAKDKGYNLVITKQNVIVGEQSIDITDETMEKLNKALPDIQLKFDEGE